jgi:hypothetical protein
MLRGAAQEVARRRRLASTPPLTHCWPWSRATARSPLAPAKTPLVYALCARTQTQQCVFYTPGPTLFLVGLQVALGS